MKKSIFTLLVLFLILSVQAQDKDLTGSKAPEFAFVDMNGNLISSENTKGKVVVLNFWFIGCRPCLKEIPELNKVYNKYQTNPDIVFAAITFDNLEKVNKNLAEYNIKYPIVTDGKETCKLFQVKGYPTNIIIDKKGNYHLYSMGGFSGIGKFISRSTRQALKR